MYLLVVMAMVISACNKSDDEIVLDFELTFPEDWVKYIYAEEGRVLDAYRYDLTADTLTESLVVFRTRTQLGSLPLYYNAVKADLTKSLSYDSLRYESDTTINEIIFKKLISHEFLWMIDEFTRDTTFVGVVSERFFTFRNDVGYNLTFLSVDSEYEDTKDTFGDIISTFRFK